MCLLGNVELHFPEPPLCCMFLTNDIARQDLQGGNETAAVGFNFDIQKEVQWLVQVHGVKRR